MLEQGGLMRLINCTAYNCGTYGFLGGDNTVDDHIAANCVAINCADGFLAFDGPSARYFYTYNCYAGACTNDYSEEGANSALTNNYSMSEDETADDFDGANNTTGVACATDAGAYFVNVTATTEDTNINNAASDLIGAGDDLDGNAWWPLECETAGDGLDYADTVRS
jgi:hypothetical protein